MSDIHLWGVKQNNLKNIEVKIPLGKMTVICGPSGSGKSSLAFETLFAEGQRRFIESMSNYARQFLNKAPKPNIDGIENIPPAIAIEQKNSVKGSRSTVGTTTEIIDYLRLLFEKIGISYCPNHHVPTEKQSVTEAADLVVKKFQGQRGYILVPLPPPLRLGTNKELLASFLRDGYTRIMVKDGIVIDLKDPAIAKKGLPKAEFSLVIDRLSFSSDERARIADSIQQAYEASLRFTHSAVRFAVVRSVNADTPLKLSEENSCPICDYKSPAVSTRLFSFNSPLGACPTCKGFGNILSLDPTKVIPNPKLSVADGALQPFTMPSAVTAKKSLDSFCRKNKISRSTPWEELPAQHQQILWEGGNGFMGVVGLFEELERMKYKMHVRVFISRFRSGTVCPSCRGGRLREEALQVKIHQHTMADFSAMSIADLDLFFQRTEFTKFENEVAGEVLKQIRARLQFLVRVGVHYLSLGRETKTLSGGEFQRLMLANQLGMGLTQTLYVLDEPTVGLHPRDNDRLISILHDLRNADNTLVVVEHDHDVIRSSDHVIEIGPGSGYLGGEVVLSQPTAKFLTSQSLTASYLLPARNSVPLSTSRPVDREAYKFKLELFGSSGHNLKNLDVVFPLNRFVVVTGVSGSGKSTLVTKTLYPALARALDVDFLQGLPYQNLLGADLVQNVVLVDQSPIGKTARSSPITYMQSFDAIRNIFAALPESKFQGYLPGAFSLNVDGGRCPACKGTGVEEIDMMFMDNVVLPCDVCDGKKYRDEILEIKFKGKNIHEVLQLTVAEAMDFFVAYPNIRKPLSFLKEVGLDYLQLGQSAASFSGGESQRMKIAKELSQAQQKATVYILDEPTTGLHFREVDLLLKVLHRLIEAGGSVIVIEHNLDVIRSADYVIDLGPDAGPAGGYIVAAGSPQELLINPQSITGQYLKKYLGMDSNYFSSSSGSPVEKEISK